MTTASNLVISPATEDDVRQLASAIRGVDLWQIDADDPRSVAVDEMLSAVSAGLAYAVRSNTSTLVIYGIGAVGCVWSYASEHFAPYLPELARRSAVCLKSLHAMARGPLWTIVPENDRSKMGWLGRRGFVDLGANTRGLSTLMRQEN